MVAATSPASSARARRSTSASSARGRPASTGRGRPANVTASASGRSRDPSQTGHGTRPHELEHPLAHGRAAGVRQGVQHVPPGALVLALVGALDAPGLALGVDGHHRLLVGEEDPVAVGLVELAPRPVDVVAEGGEDVAQVLALPRTGPGRDRAVADAQRGVGDERLLGGAVHPAEPVALGAGAGGGVGGERVGVQPLRAGRIGAGAGVQHPQRVGQRGDRAHRGAGAAGAAALLQRDGRRQPGDLARPSGRRPAGSAGGRTARPTRSSGAAPRRTSSRTPARTCRSRRRR